MQGRLISLDAFRGLTVALMILVNNPGSWAHIYPPFRHAHWHGWTPTDLVFPFFLFAVGVAISLSFARRLEGGAGQGDLLAKIFRRTVIIFLLGLFLNGFPFTGGTGQWADLRLWGVLQRIAVCYLLTGVTVVLVRGNRRRALVGLACLLLYELGMRLPLVAGWGTGSFELETNFARWLDLRLWSAAHLYQGAGLPFDPEGLWTTLPATVTTLLGFFTGEYLRPRSSPGEMRAKVRRLVLLGLAAAACGQALHLIEPVNKQLWTGSYVVLTGGMAWLTLAASVWAIDLRGRSSWTVGAAYPAVIFGSNALLVFVGSGILARLLVLIRVPVAAGKTLTLKHWLYTRIFAGWAGATGGSFLFALCFVLFWLGVTWLLYRRRIFIKI